MWGLGSGIAICSLISIMFSYFVKWRKLFWKDSTMVHVREQAVWNHLMFKCHRINLGLKIRRLSDLFLLIVSALLFVRAGKYRPIEGYMRNSTLLGCTGIYVRGVLEAAVMCHNDDVCGAIYRSKEKSGERGFAVCKCVTESIHTSPVYDDSNLYLKMNDVFNTGRILISKDYTYIRYSTPSTTDLSIH